MKFRAELQFTINCRSILTLFYAVNTVKAEVKAGNLKRIDANRVILNMTLLQHSNCGLGNLANSKTSWTDILNEFNAATYLDTTK